MVREENKEEIYYHGTPGFLHVCHKAKEHAERFRRPSVAVELDRRRSDCVLAGPFACGRFVSGAVGLVDMRDLRHQGIIRVGVCEHRTDGKQHFGDCQRRAPLVSENVKTDAAVGVDVGVIDPRVEADLRWLEWIVGREVNRQEEHATRVWRVTRTHDSCLPMEQVFSSRAGRARGGRITAEISEFLVNSLESHLLGDMRKKGEKERRR
jgi:hypothetical protein